MPRLAKISRPIEYFPIIGGEIKATNDAKGIVEGYLNYIGNIDFGDDRSMKGCFVKTISESYSRKTAQDLDFLWPYLWNHDYSQLPPGGIFDADEDRKGLYTKTQFNMDIQMGRELYASFKMGTMKKQSMGYKAIQVDWVKEGGKSIRNLLEVAVMEGSAVVFPMNDLAQVDTVKNRRNFYMPGKIKQDWPANDPNYLDLGEHLSKRLQPFPATTKDYAASYAETLQQDWCSDLWNLWYPLRNEIIVAFQTGDTPVADVQAALTQFSAATLAYVQRGVELDMMEYLQPADDSGGGMPMMMSSDDNPETKDVKKLSAASHAKMMKAVGGMEGHIKEMKSELSRQRANALQGYQVYSAPTDELEQKEDEPPTEEEELDEAAILNKLRATVDDLASTLQFENAFKGI